MSNLDTATQSTVAKKGRLVGVGVGPGDPELLTVKAWRLLQTVDVLSFLVNDRGESQAKTIAQAALDERGGDAVEIPIFMPMLTERQAANEAYDQGAIEIARELENGRDVAFLCEGDPLFYGSFSYLLERLENQYDTCVVPGITSVNAAAATLVTPLTMLKESFAVVNGRLSDEDILSALAQHPALVIMKAGQARPRLLELIRQSGRSRDANYLEYIGRENQRVVTDIDLLTSEAGPYFSLFVLTPSERKSR